MKPHEVIIFGSGIGETSLELTQRTGERRILIVRVLPSGLSRARTVTQTVAQSRIAPEASVPEPATDFQTPAPSANTGNNEAQTTEPASPNFTQTEPEVKTPISATPTPAALQQPREKWSLIPRLEFSAETVYQFDRETSRMFDAELMNPQKLREAVFAAGGERLITNSQNEQKVTVRRSSLVTPLSFLYEMSDRNSLTVIVPYIRRQDEIVVGGTSVKTRGQGLGDIQVRFERRYPRLLKSAWEGTTEFDVGLPTGKSIYDESNNQSPLGIGHYEIGSVFGARRIFDPLTFSAAVGLSYSLSRTVNGTRITPGLGYSVQTSFGFALSDRWILSEQISYSRRPNVFLSTPIDAETVSTDQAYLGHSLIYRPRGGHTLRMMFNLGLNPASSDYGFGFTYSYRRNSR